MPMTRKNSTVRALAARRGPDRRGRRDRATTRTTVAATLGAAALTALAAVVTAPAASAAPGTYVSFGDSIPANPTAADIVAVKAKVPDWPGQTPGRCPQGDPNLGKEVAALSGLELRDHSCPGAMAYRDRPLAPGMPLSTLTSQVDEALADGDLTADTRLISVIIGLDDAVGSTIGDLNVKEQRDAEYQRVVGEQLDRIRAAAPNARIVIAGYPDETDGHNRTCGSNLLGVTTHWYYPLMSAWQEEVRDQQRRVAESRGLEFLDMMSRINVAAGNSGCLQDGPRLNATLYDDAPHNLMGHLTDEGNRYYARAIVGG